jgi:hypothetical protein
VYCLSAGISTPHILHPFNSCGELNGTVVDMTELTSGLRIYSNRPKKFSLINKGGGIEMADDNKNQGQQGGTGEGQQGGGGQQSPGRNPQDEKSTGGQQGGQGEGGDGGSYKEGGQNEQTRR